MNIPFRAIGVFHAVARAASISKAAAELGVTPSAISQQVRSLEQMLGTSLVVKAGRRVKLTESGERFFEMIASDVEHIAEATERIRGRPAVTMLTVRATPSFSTKWLLPRLPSFIDSFPRYELRLDGTNEPTDFTSEEVDVEIRHGTGTWPGLFVEPVAEEHFFPVCAPSYAAPASLQAACLPEHRLIHSVKSQVQWLPWLQAQGIRPEQRWRRVLFDRSHMAIDAAVAGVGIALESNLMMWRELGAGSLACPVPRPPRTTLVTQWIVCPHDHLRHAKVRVFLDWLRAERDRWLASVAEPAWASEATAA